MDVGILEGGINNTSNEEVHTGCANAAKSWSHWEIARFSVVFLPCGIFSPLKNHYAGRISKPKARILRKIPDDPELCVPTRVRALQEVVPVDVFVPGCPPDADTIFYALSELAQGRIPVLKDKNLRWQIIGGNKMVAQKITIEPVTRIEGHAKVTIRMTDDGTVEHAYMHINEFRGFEKFCEGRMVFEMPHITPRICGICPVSHHLASAKAGDEVMGCPPPRTATLLRN